MATKSQRELFAFVCTVCKRQNYVSKKNKLNTPDKLVLRKFCKHCRKYTEHKESNKLD